MCFLMLEGPALLDRAAVRAALIETAPRSDLEISERKPNGSGAGLQAIIDEQSFAISSEPGRLPEEILATIRNFGVFWPQCNQVLAEHGGYVSVSASKPAKGYGLARAQAIALTRLAVALARTTAALGMVWPASGIAVPIERLEAMLPQIQRDRWPVDIWIGLQLGRGIRNGQQMIGARSRGAADYFGAEIDVFPLPTSDKTRPLRILMPIIAHMMSSGARLQNGQPVQFPGEPPMQVVLLPGEDGNPALIRVVPAQADNG
jgi:hypothetical protein